MIIIKVNWCKLEGFLNKNMFWITIIIIIIIRNIIVIIINKNNNMLWHFIFNLCSEIGASHTKKNTARKLEIFVSFGTEKRINENWINGIETNSCNKFVFPTASRQLTLTHQETVGAKNVHLVMNLKLKNCAVMKKSSSLRTGQKQLEPRCRRSFFFGLLNWNYRNKWIDNAWWYDLGDNPPGCWLVTTRMTLHF